MDSTRRFRLFVILALMAALALGSFWVLEVIRRSARDSGSSAVRTEPDFYVENFSYVRMSETGVVRYQISGKKLTHNPQDDSYDVLQPVVRNLNAANEVAMTMRADRGRIDSDNSKVHMYDNVHLDRPKTSRSEPLHVASEYLLLLPDEDVVKTDEPVEITSAAGKLTGVGMYANNATRELRLSNNVHGTYQARGR